MVRRSGQNSSQSQRRKLRIQTNAQVAQWFDGMSKEHTPLTAPDDIEYSLNMRAAQQLMLAERAQIRLRFLGAVGVWLAPIASFMVPMPITADAVVTILGMTFPASALVQSLVFVALLWSAIRYLARTLDVFMVAHMFDPLMSRVNVLALPFSYQVGIALLVVGAMAFLPLAALTWLATLAPLLLLLTLPVLGAVRAIWCSDWAWVGMQVEARRQSLKLPSVDFARHFVEAVAQAGAAERARQDAASRAT